MKKYLVFLLLTIIAINSQAQRKIKKLEVEEIGFNVKLNFKPEINELSYNDLKLTITPQSTSDLNDKFLNESNLNGKLEYSHYEKSRNSYFLKKRKRKHEKSDYEFLLAGVDWLLDNDKIITEEFDELVRQIVLNYDLNTGREIYNSQRIISCNPYYIKNKYLNTYEIVITNTSNSYKIFNSNLLIETGNLLLNPISSVDLIEQLEQCGLLNQNKIQTINRYNLPNEIVIPPNSKIIKYFSTVPIDYNNHELKISFQGLNKKFKWTIEKQHNKFDDKYIFFELENTWYYDDFSSESGTNFYLVKSSGDIFFTNDVVYIGENNLNEEFELISISLYSDKIYFAKTKIKGIDVVDLEKYRRKPILIKTAKIDELKKKVKQ